MHGYQKRCPELYWDDAASRYACRLAADPVRGEEFRFLLAIGEGCCAKLNSWRDNVKYRG